MPRTEPFDKYPDQYDNWFSHHSAEYALELKALQPFIPRQGAALEVGIGSGMFAEPLGINLGIDPSFNMLLKARARGLNVALGKAEALPFPDACFTCLLMVTSICFIDDVDHACSEAYRVLHDNGQIVIGFINKDSHLGRQYQDRKESSHFYQEATFFSTEEVIHHLEQAGFKNFTFRQALFSDDDTPQDVREGCDEGAFIAIRAQKQG